LVFSAVPLETFQRPRRGRKDQKGNLQTDLFTKLAPAHHRAHACNDAR